MPLKFHHCHHCDRTLFYRLFAGVCLRCAVRLDCARFDLKADSAFLQFAVSRVRK